MKNPNLNHFKPFSQLARTVLVFSLITLTSSEALSNPEHPWRSVNVENTEPRLDMLEEVAMFDRLQTDSRRLIDLVQGLSQVSHMLSVLKPYREAVLTLLDRDLPVEERWHQAMSLAPDLKDGSDVPVENSGGNPELEAELVSLRSEVDALRAELSVLGKTPWMPEPDLPEESLEVNLEVEDDWVLGRESIRYVQLPAPGTDTEPAVWLTSAGDGLRVGVNETVFVDGKSIRLAEFRERPGGRIRLLFAVDGEPSTIDW